jgi:hypothetical protein
VACPASPQGRAIGRLERVALLGMAGDVILLVKDLAIDPRVSRRATLLAGFAVAYLISPRDLVPDVIPVTDRLATWV